MPLPPNARRADGPSRRVLVAVGAPIALVAVAGALALATPAIAAGNSPTLPFPTLCGTATPTTDSASPSASASTSRSATATPQASASPSGKTTSAKAGAGKSDPPSSSPSASASTSAAAGSNNVPGTPPPPPPPSPSASPSASQSSSSGGGFWGWLNGVWTWIFGSAQLPHAAAAPVMNAAYVRTGAKTAPKAAVAAAAAAAPAPTESCIPKSAVKANAATSGGNTAAEIPWHLSSPSMTMYSLTYNGVTTINTDKGPEQVLDFTAAKVTLLSMVTFSQQGGGRLQYVDGGPNQTVTLNNAHLWTTSITSNVLGLIHQTFTPQNPGLLTLLQGLTIPIPVLFTNVEADNAFLNTQSIVIPGFNGHGN